MLALLQQHLDALRAAKNDADIVRVLKETNQNFGFRSAYLIEYDGQFSKAQHVLDTDPTRKLWWDDYFANYTRPKAKEVEKMLGAATLLRFNANRFAHTDEKTVAAYKKYDMVDLVVIPISEGGVYAGSTGFCGAPDLDAQEEMALQLISYTVFLQTRSFRNISKRLEIVSLTPREKEVVRLSAEGMTSQEIALKLGMSTRTANQHLDNVSDKLGTKNRAHTVAEVIRHDLLN